MKELSAIEVGQVSGGDSWGGTPDGQAPYEPSPTSKDVVDCAIDLMKYGSDGFVKNLIYCYVTSD